MFSTCLYCTKSLGANSVFETFPTGQRLAFHAATGRLWVVCRHCERWNMSPLEERWEAIEEGERFYRDTRTRVATDNIGLARLGDGTTIVRIGAPLRPEFAAWRYGDQFGRRRRKQMLIAASGLAAVGAVVAASIVSEAAIGFAVFLGMGALRPVIQGRRRAVVARLPIQEDGVAKIRSRDLLETRLGRTEAGAMLVRLTCDAGTFHFAGPDAERVLAMAMPKVNRYGGTAAVVRGAVAELERCGGSEAFLVEATDVAPMYTHPLGLFSLPETYALALEMALHEEAERRAMHGELAELARAWEEAEYIAAIADELEVPDDVAAAFSRLKSEHSDNN